MDYTFKERTILHPKDLLRAGLLIFFVLCLLFVLGLIVIRVPELTDKVVVSIISIVGGYGLGKSNAKIPFLEDTDSE